MKFSLKYIQHKEEDLNRKMFGLTMLLLCFIISCKKETASTQKTTTTLPNIDTVIMGTKTIFIEPPITVQSPVNSSISVTVARSSPCYPSHEVYYFTANTPNITDTLHTTYTWTIRMASTYTMQGKKVQFVFEKAWFGHVELEIKTNGVVVDFMKVYVTPLGQKANNRNVGIQADCIDNNRKNFVSLFSTDNDPLDGYINARYWDFDDGTNSNQKFNQHEFPLVAMDRNYFVKLFVNNSSGCKDSATMTVFVPAHYADTVRYKYTQTSACYPSEEEFTFMADTTKMPANAIYLWDFHDYVNNYPGKVVKHKFAFPNKYYIELSVMHQGREISHYRDSVYAKGQNVTPIAYFYAKNESNSTDSSYWFYDCKSKFDNGGFLTDIIWDYGDGFSEHKSQYAYNAWHVYPRLSVSKTYTAKMVITATSGCKDSTTTTIIVPPK